MYVCMCMCALTSNCVLWQAYTKIKLRRNTFPVLPWGALQEPIDFIKTSKGQEIKHPSTPVCTCMYGYINKELLWLQETCWWTGGTATLARCSTRATSWWLWAGGWPVGSAARCRTSTRSSLPVWSYTGRSGNAYYIHTYIHAQIKCYTYVQYNISVAKFNLEYCNVQYARTVTILSSITAFGLYIFNSLFLFRDEIRCKNKYGEDWDVYTKKVPNVFFPSWQFYPDLLSGSLGKKKKAT